MSWDGVWQVTTPRVCAGFVIKNGALVDCAPVLRGRIFTMEGRIWFQERNGGTTWFAERITDR
jgi:hypothetical protein